MDFLRRRPETPKPVERVQAVVEEIKKIEVDLPKTLKSAQNLRALQTAHGILRALSFRV